MVVAVTRLGLTILGYRRISSLFVLRGAPRQPSPRELGRVAWGVRAAARLIPGASCLTQALAGQYLLGRSGVPSIVRIGVRRGDNASFAAHAWLISEGAVLLGAVDDPLRFTPLTDLTVT
jgi:hypothetical protein